MTTLAATATGHPLAVWLLLAGAAVVWALVYAGSCWLWPFKPCLRCKGSGRIHRDDRKVHRLCRRCSATGRRLRVGRRVWNWSRRTCREGVR